MRVLHFYKSALPDSVGGVAQMIHHLAIGTRRLGVQVDVLSTTPKAQPSVISVGGYTLHRAGPSIELASTSMSLAALRLYATLVPSVDIVHYHFPWPFMDVVHFAVNHRTPSVVTYHSDIVRQRTLLALYRPLQRRFLGSVGAIVATSPNYSATSEVLAEHAAKVRVIPIGLDPEDYPPVDPARVAYWRSVVGPRFFLFIGVLRYYKGLQVLLDAARDGRVPIVIAGAGSAEGPLRAQARRLKLDHITFLGHVTESDKVALISLCEAVLLPSHLRSEAFGITLLEGAMYGKPMICSEIGTGTSYVNVAEETGIVVPPEDSGALRAAMDYLWDNPSVARAMGARARERHRQHFTAGQMSRSYLELYREVLGRS
jgi:glycosyltransferase involved in cell wall biosynthesis